MDGGNDLIKKQEEGLIVPSVSFEDIVTIESARLGLENLKGEVKKTYEKKLEQQLKNAPKRVTKSFLGKFFKKEFDVLDKKFFESGYNDLMKALVKEIFPAELYEIIDYKDGIEGVIEKLKKIIEENNIFLKYFFATPVNEADWEIHIKRNIPVVTRTDFLFGSSESIHPFDQREHQRGRSSSEDMKMVPFTMTSEQFTFYLRKIFDSVKDYNNYINRFADILRKYQKEIPQLPDHLKMDFEMMNYCLQNLLSGKYSPQAGIFAINLNTAVSRIKKTLEKKVVEPLDETAHCFLSARDKKPEYFGRLAERIGFKVKDYFWNGLLHSDHQPKCAYRRLQNPTINK